MQGKARRGVRIVMPFFGLVPIASVLARECIVPDYARKADVDFLVNDLIRFMPADMQCIVPEEVAREELQKVTEPQRGVLAASRKPAPAAAGGVQGSVPNGHGEQKAAAKKLRTWNKIYAYNDSSYHANGAGDMRVTAGLQSLG